MTLYCIKCGQAVDVKGIHQDPCTECGGMVFVSVQKRRPTFTKSDRDFLRSIRVAAGDDGT